MVINLTSDQTGIMQFVFVSVLGKAVPWFGIAQWGCGFAEGLLVSGVVRGKADLVVLSQVHSGS